MLKFITFLFIVYPFSIALNSALMAQQIGFDENKFPSSHLRSNFSEPPYDHQGSGIDNSEHKSNAWIDKTPNRFRWKEPYSQLKNSELTDKGSGFQFFSRATELLSGKVKEEWVQNYSSRLESSADYVSAAVIDTDGNIYITGLFGVWIRSSFYAEGFRTVKIKTDGTEEWVTIYTSENIPSRPTDIAVDGSGNVYVTGISVHDSINHYYWDYTTIKYNSSGIEQWVAFFDGPGNGDDFPYGIAIDESANIYVTGYCWGGASEDYATIKYNSDGVQQWVTRYDGPGNLGDAGYDIVLDKLGNCYVTGISYGQGTMFDCATIKYDKNGDEQWVVRYNNPDGIGDAAYKITIDDSSNIYIAGRSNGAATSDDYITIKYDSNGVEKWAARYNGSDNNLDGATDLAVDGFGNVFVTGWSSSFTTGFDFATVKYNSLGVEQWVASYNGPGNDVDDPYALVVDDSGNVFVTGSCNYPEDFATVKYSSAGEEQWVSLFNGSGNSADWAVSILLDMFGDTYVTGSSFGLNTNYDFATVKYNPSGIEQLVIRSDGPKVSLDTATDLAIDSSGNVYVIGKSKSDAVTVKYNSAGDEEWAIRDNEGEPTAIAVDIWGNVYVTGISFSSNTFANYKTIKYDSYGNKQWVALYNGPTNSSDLSTAIAVDVAGNVFVTGQSMGFNGLFDFATIKYNANGLERWITRYNGPANLNDEALALAIDTLGNVFVTGITDRSGIVFPDYATIKYDSSGVQKWIARYNGSANSSDYAKDIAVDKDGNVYVTGYSEGLQSSYDYTSIKYNSSGEQQWIARYNGSGNLTDRPSSIAVDVSGNVYVTGYGVGLSTDRDYVTIKYNSDGVQQWVAQYNGPGNSDDEATALVLDAFGNSYVTGFSYSGSSWIFSDFATIKYDSSGVEQWVMCYNDVGISYDVAVGLVVDASANVYVTGISQGTFENWRVFTTIKYNQPPTTVDEIILHIPETFVLAQNYPNPFNPITTIRWQTPTGSWQTLKVYDVLGNEIATLVDEYKPAGSYNIDFDASCLSSGVYFYQLKAGEFADTKKIILLK